MLTPAEPLRHLSHYGTTLIRCRFVKMRCLLRFCCFSRAALSRFVFRELRCCVLFFASCVVASWCSRAALSRLLFANCVACAALSRFVARKLCCRELGCRVVLSFSRAALSRLFFAAALLRCCSRAALSRFVFELGCRVVVVLSFSRAALWRFVFREPRCCVSSCANCVVAFCFPRAVAFCVARTAFMRFGARAGPIRPQLGPNTGLVCVHPRAVR